jgi:DNA repair protein MmcB-like
MNSIEILELLEKKHKDDVFVAECKNGPTHTGDGHIRMDAWVMRKSWSKPMTTVYEIKVDRGDFKRDDKWHMYLPYCNEFYFACPKGVIEPGELPPEAGLVIASKNGRLLFVKKKPQRRTVHIPEEVYRYILMARIKITRETYESESAGDYWGKWLAQREKNKDLGYMVSRKIREIVESTIIENNNLKRQIEVYETLGKRLDELGINPKNPASQWNVRRKIDEFMGEIPSEFIGAIDRTISVLNNVKEVHAKFNMKDGINSNESL